MRRSAITPTSRKRAAPALRAARSGAERRRHLAAHPFERRIQELCAEADAAGVESLTARQQLVVRTWAALGVIHNGGFRHLLEGEWPLGAVAQGFEVLGFADAAGACERVRAAVAAWPALTEGARRSAVRDARGHDGFHAEGSAVFSVSFDALATALARYMREHPNDFPGLPRDPDA
ncbi:MAG TPA: hypothetical protein VEB43_10240 [Anaeromyxobacter sp.]|nr:hypothetical protein [Anaeromyxobacter sp.]